MDLSIEMSTGWLLAGLLVSSVGTGLFVYGKKQARLPQVFAGIAMTIYPGFVSSPALILAIFGLICGGVWVVVRAGA